MFMCCEQNAGQNHNVKRGNKPFVNVVNFTYLGATDMNQNLHL